ncbi:PTS sugar transporter subunit IIB [Collinsella vaginalis]|uniref:PTS sugar transporter subunit IIB n=1 Tax=Collinsella vaginalis TaxID=1870987 RepID=UPI000A269D3F|nr:hypothetical protein [Collinsella vaginalis]
MHNVVMLCAAGTSTHLFAEKIQKEIDAEGYGAHVSAWSVSQAKENHTSAELLLLTPQVGFEQELVQALYPDTKVEVIDFDAFARMDADAVIEQIKQSFSA